MDLLVSTGAGPLACEPGCHSGNTTPIPAYQLSRMCVVLPNTQIRKLVQDRIVAPESHTRPQRWFTRLLHATGLAKSIPLFHPVTESIYHKSYLGTAASHALVVTNWTMEMMARVPSTLERSERNLLLFEASRELKGSTVR